MPYGTFSRIPHGGLVRMGLQYALRKRKRRYDRFHANKKRKVPPKKTQSGFGGQPKYKKKRKTAAIGAGISKSFAYTAYRPKRGLALNNARRDVWQKTDTANVTSLIGQQGSNNITEIFTGDYFDALTECMATSANMDALQPFAPGNDGMGAFYIEKITLRTTYTNAGPNMCKLTLYSLIAKDDEVPLPAQAWDDGLVNESGISSAQSSFPGSSPLTVESFRRFWRHIKTDVIYLESGYSHEQVFCVAPKQLAPISKMKELTNIGQTVRGWSLAILAVVQGMPLSNQASAGPAVVSLGKAKVVSVTTKRIVSRLLSLKSKKISQTNDLADQTTMVDAFAQNVTGDGVNNEITNVGYNNLSFA